MSAIEEQRIGGDVAKQQARETMWAIGDYDGSRVITSAALIGIGVLIEPELLAGAAIGAGIILGFGWVGALVSGAVRPVVKTAVKTGYVAVARTRKIVAEAAEGVQDMVAEARAEHEGKPSLH
jgi:hypothetical protein